MNYKPGRLLIAIVLLSFGVLACLPNAPDQGVKIVIINGTTMHLTVNAAEGPDLESNPSVGDVAPDIPWYKGNVVLPGEQFVDYGIARLSVGMRENAPVRVYGVDATSRIVVFKRVYTYLELDELDWRVEIVDMTK